MRICIPVKTALEGGGNSFVVNFRRYLDSQGIPHTEGLADRYDILFTMHWVASYESILAGLRRNPRARIVHRIDGAARDYGREGGVDLAQRKINLLADLTIFQSRYCKHSTREKFPIIVHDGPVIHNPVDVEQFRPDGERVRLSEGVNVVCATWSTNPKKGARSIYAAAESNADATFVLCGRYPDAPALPNLRRMGMLGRDELARVMRSCDALYFPSENEACPNVVLEALASGLPVLYKDSGATPELVGDCGLPAEAEGFRERLNEVMARREELGRKARERALALFSPEVAFPRYLEEMERSLEQPLAAPTWRRSLAAWNPRHILSFNGRNAVRALRARSRRSKAARDKG
ncbi:MAG: glycosyltransferase family 4 protein [Chloroflexi bacterium]|nr:glycosyltransferase family 4 protein [Chloroflexota bacterium]